MKKVVILVSLFSVFCIGCSNGEYEHQNSLVDSQAKFVETLENNAYIYQEYDGSYVKDNISDGVRTLYYVNMELRQYSMYIEDASGYMAITYDFNSGVSTFDSKQSVNSTSLNATLVHNNDGFSCVSNPIDEQLCYIAKEFIMSNYQNFTQLLLKANLTENDLK